MSAMLEHVFDILLDDPALDAWNEQRARDLDLLDEVAGDVPTWSDERYAAWVEELIAGDPEIRPEPSLPGLPPSGPSPSDSSIAVLVAAAEREPVTPAMVTRLAAVDPAGVDDEVRVGLAVAWARVRNYADGMLASVVAAQVAATAPLSTPDGKVRLEPERLVSAELGAALHLGTGGADLLVSASTALLSRLPSTLTAVRSGDVSWAKATSLAVRAAALTTEQARAVEARVLPRAATRTPARHADMVRRWVDRIDPAGAEDRRRKALEDIDLVRAHHGAGMGELFARMPSEQLDLVWTAADHWARARKADGDARCLAVLRVAALAQWAGSFLTHGHPSHCDVFCDPFAGGVCSCAADRPEGPSDDDPDDIDAVAARRGDVEPSVEGPVPMPAATAQQTEPLPAPMAAATAQQTEVLPAPTADGAALPTRQGRPAVLHAIWDLASLLGVTFRCGELTDSGATVPPEAMRELVARGVRIRRLLIDPDTGELVDLSPIAWRSPPRDPAPMHGPPVVLGVVLDTALHRALATGDITDVDPDRRALLRRITDALSVAPASLRALLEEMLGHPVTADALDDHPTAYPPRAGLVEFVTTRDRHPVNPTAGTSAAAAADLDHTTSVRDGGGSVRDNLASLTRRWHLLKTHAGWTVRRSGGTWQWTSPTGRTSTTEPHDFRLGP